MILRQSRKLRSFVSIAAWLAPAAAIALFVAPGAMLLGQSRFERIPDMRGRWQGTITAYVFKNVFESDPPQYFEASTEEEILPIQYQNGRVFAGVFPDGGKLTGVVLDDGTVSIQLFGEGVLRALVTCRLQGRAGSYEMTGHTQYFEDLAPWADSFAIGTAEVRYVKMD